MKNPNQRTVLSIAGSDSSGGAGIQADIRAITHLDCHAATAITALTAQNSQGVQAISEVSASFVLAQLKAIFAEGAIHAIKIGMLYSIEIINTVTHFLNHHTTIPIVVDPVMVATSGDFLIKDTHLKESYHDLFAFATLITPNLPEAEYFSDSKINTLLDMKKAAKTLSERYQCSVLIKGGHLEDKQATDIFYSHSEKRYIEYQQVRINTNCTHGTGCVLSSAIASFLTQDKEISEAIRLAKQYLTEQLMSCRAAPLDTHFVRG
ncbi:MAG: bifunctional hydroxymethylpyrimidine kinase/phosphomethylpyrimidine kinase [Gammaproteobacteria bacterium RIFCSPHIGHO2_12_FULL_41_15]|nr:MAG: bifunctional hydroxymethylpyrimidine kinase/phosphomethylpyrimidine kinase [Gammaproteobacteria bacterium RIFCSPHIGHO2_12_FULL_41_15]